MVCVCVLISFENMIIHKIFFLFFQAMIEDVELPLVPRESVKRFRKQQISKAKSSEIIYPVDDEMHNELYATTTIGFRPVVDPRRFDVKMPEKVQYGGVAFNLFPCFETGISHIFLNAKDHVNIGTGVIVNTGLQVIQNPATGFEHAPNWFGQIVSTKEMEKAGVYTGSAIIDPHDEDEIGISLFNMGMPSSRFNKVNQLDNSSFQGVIRPRFSSLLTIWRINLSVSSFYIFFEDLS